MVGAEVQVGTAMAMKEQAVQVGGGGPRIVCGPISVRREQVQMGKEVCGVVTMTNCNIYENSASHVSACFLNLP